MILAFVLSIVAVTMMHNTKPRDQPAVSVGITVFTLLLAANEIVKALQ